MVILGTNMLWELLNIDVMHRVRATAESQAAQVARAAAQWIFLRGRQQGGPVSLVAMHRAEAAVPTESMEKPNPFEEAVLAGGLPC